MATDKATIEDLKDRLDMIFDIILGTEAQGINLSFKIAWSHDAALNEIVKFADYKKKGE